MLPIILSIIVSATLDSAYITIGDQTALHLSATCPTTEQVTFPTYGDTFIDGVEIVRRTAIDSTTDQQGKHYTQDLVLTSFTDSLFLLPAVPFVSEGDTTYSDALTLNVIQPFVLDSTMAITDIRPIQEAPIWWWGIIRIILGILLLLGLGTLVWWILNKMGRYTGTFVPKAKPEPLRPAEEIALEELDRIREERIWTQGQTKQYHTELTDALRTYIARRFDVASTEKTSEETLRAMRPLLADKHELYASLSKVLRQADMVKFAKWQTTPEENEDALRTAYDFVHLTTAEKPSNENNIEKEELS